MKLSIFKLLSLSTCFSLLCTFTSFAGTWHQENNHWQYLEGGSYVTNSWIADKNNWYYLDENGFMKTGWLLDNNHWYYLDSDGTMISGTTLIIDGINYQFNNSGQWLETPTTGWSGNTYSNKIFNYSITIPEGFNLEDVSSDETIHFYAEKDTVLIAAANTPMEAGKKFSDYINELTGDEIGADETVQISDVYIGGYQYKKIAAKYYDSMYFDIYCRQSGADLFCIMAFYYDHNSSEINTIINSVRKIN